MIIFILNLFKKKEQFLLINYFSILNLKYIISYITNSRSLVLKDISIIIPKNIQNVFKNYKHLICVKDQDYSLITKKYFLSCLKTNRKLFVLYSLEKLSFDISNIKTKKKIILINNSNRIYSYLNLPNFFSNFPLEFSSHEEELNLIFSKKVYKKILYSSHLINFLIKFIIKMLIFSKMNLYFIELSYRFIKLCDFMIKNLYIIYYIKNML
ncbi:hypothetical protein [Candidatus Vidania fulgoroideorum]